jgi:hypothetical protein
MVKICAGAENWTPTEILIGRAGKTSRYSTGETPPIKAERPEPSDHLRSTCLRGSERELFSQTWRKSAVGDSAKPK